MCVLQRHSGVLGLAALVEAYPYSVPTWLPDVVDELAMHLHDPAPIAVSIIVCGHDIWLLFCFILYIVCSTIFHHLFLVFPYYFEFVYGSYCAWQPELISRTYPKSEVVG